MDIKFRLERLEVGKSAPRREILRSTAHLSDPFDIFQKADSVYDDLPEVVKATFIRIYDDEPSRDEFLELIFDIEVAALYEIGKIYTMELK